MQFTYIAARAVAAAVALNSGAAFSEDHLTPVRVDHGKDASITVVGKLACLQEYVAKGSHATSTGTTSTSQTSELTARADSTRPGTLTGTTGTTGSVRTDAALPSARDQGYREGARTPAAPLDKNPGSSHGKTLVLVTQRGSVQGTQGTDASPARVTSSTAGQTPFGQPRPDSRNLPSTSPTAEGGQPYILFFSDDSKGQSAYAKAKGMITDGSSNWAVSDTEASDRLQVRAEQPTDSATRRDETRAQQPLANPTIRADQKEKDPDFKGLKDASQVKVTGKIMSRGGIQGIQVSDISLASMHASISGPNPGRAERDYSDRDQNKKQE